MADSSKAMAVALSPFFEEGVGVGLRAGVGHAGR
jgi:hypothetical protein